MDDLRHIVLTGVGRPGQVGEAVAQSFATPGTVLHLVDRDPSVADRARELAGRGATVQAHVADLTDGAAVRAVTTSVGPRVHALIHMAGGFAMSGPVIGADIAVMRRQLAISLETAFVATQAFFYQCPVTPSQAARASPRSASSALGKAALQPSREIARCGSTGFLA